MPSPARNTPECDAALPAATELVSQTLTALQNQRGGLVDFVEGLLGETERLSVRLEEKERDIATQQKQLRDRERQLSQQREENDRIQHALDSQQSQLESLLDEVGQLRCEMAETREVDVVSDDSELLARFNEANDERNDLRRQSKTLQDDLRSTRSQLDQANQTLAEQSSLQADQTTLENELELVRHRATELTERLALQQQEHQHQQALWSGELQQMRQLLTQALASGSKSTAQTDGIGHESSTSVEPAPVEEPFVASDTEEDVVVDSIMEQFNKLQQDVARRRQRSKSKESADE